jgi:tetratricopeptide (TPR) repeat protein
MGSLLLNAQREAGEKVFLACERLLGVEGPTALARHTRRSKTWWSRLRSGKGGALPSWTELERILPTDLPPPTWAAFRQVHREAWLLVHDPEQLQAVPSLSLQELPEQSLAATRDLAFQAFRGGDYATALPPLKLLEHLLRSQGEGRLAIEDLRLLGDCLDQQSICHGHLGQHPEAIAAAQRREEVERKVGDDLRLTYAIHQVGLARHGAGQQKEAVRAFRLAQARYQRLGETGEVVRVRRDIAQVLMGFGHVTAGRRELVRILRDAGEVEPRYVFPVMLLLVEAYLWEGSAAAARRELSRIDAYVELHRATLADTLARQYLKDQWIRLRKRAGEVPKSGPPR